MHRHVIDIDPTPPPGKEVNVWSAFLKTILLMYQSHVGVFLLVFLYFYFTGQTVWKKIQR